MQVSVLKRLKGKSNLQHRFVLLVNRLDLIPHALKHFWGSVNRLIQQQICRKIEVVPNVLLEITVCTRTIRHWLNEVKSDMRIAGCIRDYARHHKVFLMILYDCLSQCRFVSEIFSCGRLSDHYPIGVTERGFWISGNQGKGKHVEEC